MNASERQRLRALMLRWIRRIDRTDPVPAGIQGLYFGVFEGVYPTLLRRRTRLRYAVYLSGAKQYDADDDDWACDQDYTPSRLRYCPNTRIRTDVSYDDFMGAMVDILTDLVARHPEIRMFQTPHIVTGFDSGGLHVIR